MECSGLPDAVTDGTRRRNIDDIVPGKLLVHGMAPIRSNINSNIAGFPPMFFAAIPPVETLNLGGAWSISHRSYSVADPHENAIDAGKLMGALRGDQYPTSEAELVASAEYSAAGEAWLSVDLGAPHLVSAVNLYVEKTFAIPGEEKTRVLLNAAEDNLATAALCDEMKVVVGGGGGKQAGKALLLPNQCR